MKNQCFALLAMSLLSCAVHAKVTLEDVYRDSREMANAVQGVSEADALADWKHNGGLPNKDGNREWHSQTFVNARSYKNNYGHEIVVNAQGGNRSNGNPYDDQNNRCHLSIAVDGKIVAESINNNDHWNKNCFVTANVPANSRYQITSTPWHSTGKYITSVHILR